MDTGAMLCEIGGLDKELSNQIIETMKSAGETTISYKGKTIVLEERQRHSRKPDKQKKEDAEVRLKDLDKSRIY